MNHLPLTCPEPTLVLIECEPINQGYGERRIYVHPFLSTRFGMWRNSPRSREIWTIWLLGHPEYRCQNGFDDVDLYLATEFAPERM